MAAADLQRQGASESATPEAPTEFAPGGFPCPICATRTGVINSRPNGEGIGRRRECQSCGFRFSTIEIVWDDEIKSDAVFRRRVWPIVLDFVDRMNEIIKVNGGGV
jgi:hypothetical protein